MSDAAPPAAQVKKEPQSFMALRHRGYRFYLVGTGLSMMADNMEHVISYWIIYQKFESPALAGFAVFSHWLPFLFFSVYAGALADRFDPRRIIQIGMGLFMLVSVLWGILFLTDTLEMWHAVVLLTIHGFAGVLWSPATQLLIHDIVGPSHLQSAVRLMSTSRTMGQLAGPAVGGGLMLAFGPSYGILVNSLIYLPLILWLWKAPYGPKFRKEGEAAGPPPRSAGGIADILSAWRLIVGNRPIVYMIVLAGASSFLVGNAFQAQMPEFAHDLGHGNDHGNTDVFYSILLAGNAMGALLGGILLESKNLLPANPRTALILVSCWCLAVGSFAMTDVYPVAVALMVMAGFCNLAFFSMATTLVQLNAPPQIRGRVIGLFNMSGHGLRAFSGITVGVGGSFIGIHSSLMLSAIALLTVAMAMLAFLLRPAANRS